MKSIRFGLGLLSLAAVAISASAVRADEGEIRRSVVKIFASKSPPNMFRPWEVSPPKQITGTGIVFQDGRILTNAHVVEFAHQIYVQPYESSEKLDAEVEFSSSDIDLATLRLDNPEAIAELKPLPLADALPPLQAKVNVYGYPTGGDTLSVTEGVVSRIEFGPYYYDAAALRIQVDAAINPGNSGGPGLVDGEVAGLVFSRLDEAENIGYLIPAEVIRHFLDDWTEDGKYDGFPVLDVNLATAENPTLRRYLKLDRDMTGMVTLRVNQHSLKGTLQRWDVIAECNGIAIDNLGMVPLTEGVRVSWRYLTTKQKPGSTVRLAIYRRGERLEVEAPTVTESNRLVQRMADERPTYFIYGGLVFSPVTLEMELSIARKFYAFLGSGSRLLAKRLRDYREQPDDEIVVLTCPILPHKLTKGYGVLPLSVVTHVNDMPVRNLRQMIQAIKDNTEEFIVFRFEEEMDESVVLDPKLVAQYQNGILRNNNIPAPCSEDLRDLWP
ncbi:MAG: trypsin-like peptidase domain-containing protein [Phycisphaerales bacterium]|nr:MAG: trypsin-like peptidase domain-containing protein [Phycisphaerales bacterium]